MSYVEKNLGKEENIVYQCKVHWAILVPHIILMLILIGFVTIIPAIITMFTTELVITNKKISGKLGLLNTKAMDSPLNKIQNVKVEQNIFGKIFNYGNIDITTASGSYNFKGIARPDSFKNALNQQIDTFDDERINKQAQKIAAGVAASVNN